MSAPSRVVPVVVVCMLALVLGWFAHAWFGPEPAGGGQAGGEPAKKKVELWTCSMHPQIKLPEPGKCPICAMDLIPLEGGGDDAGPRALVMSEASKKLAEIRTVAVERAWPTAEVRMVGKVDYDETRVKTIAAWIPGRLDRMYVDFTGVTVRKGDHLVWLYSPELFTAQEELLKARKQVDEAKAGDSDFLRESNKRSLASAREKLRLFGLDEAQVAEIEERGKAEDHILIKAPLGGIVVHKGAKEGDYVKIGEKLYRIADLSHLWVRLDAYESDLSWVRYGQKVRIETEAYPGEVFEGWVSFVDPVLDAKTRTVKVRVNVENEDGKLKPEMFVRAIVRAKVAGTGRVMDPGLVGKWISPMHPEVVKDEPGKCDVCGMPLVRAEELGYVSADKASAKPIVVPVTAVLRTGKRAVVYVERPGTEKPTFDGREIVLGPRAGDLYIVLSGLSEGERVVTNGSFKIDSALQILAKPSMMSMPAEDAPESPRAAVMRDALAPVQTAYLSLQRALAADDASVARAGYGTLGEAAGAVDMKLFEGEDHMAWMGFAKEIGDAADAGAKAADIAGLRASFGPLSAAMIELEERFGHAGEAVYREVFCPMAFDGKGGTWLQTEEDVRNPFYGADMLGCGEVKQQFAGKTGGR